MRRALLLPLIVLLAAPPALAQPTDPIGALIDHRDEEPDDPDEAAEKPLPLPPLPPPESPRPYVAPYQAPAPRPQLTAPVQIEETGKSPDAPPTAQDQIYDSRLKASFAAAQGYQGPLDGGWTVAVKDGEDLYTLQLVDRPDRLEGAWRDLRRTGSLAGSGLVDDIQRIGADIVLRFAATGGGAVTATLHGSYGGVWSGELTEGGRTRPVVLRRQRP